jgi:hemerythrin superfamily protein
VAAAPPYAVLIRAHSGRNLGTARVDERTDQSMAEGFEMLEADHRDVEARFENYLHDNDDALAREVCRALTAHTAIEEQALYPRLRRYVDGGDDLADRATTEHAAVAALIARIYDSPPASLLDLMTELRRDVEAHVGWEEAELFPSMRDAGVDAAELGAALEAARAEGEGSPS